VTPIFVKCRREPVYHPDVLRMKQVMAAYFNGQLGEPADDITSAVLKAAGEASVEDVYQHLRWLYQHGHRPGTGHDAPKGFGWILWAVKERFGK
jgi:hypothetical protein